jgi:TolB-like protein/Tfp pilus assembly protein PilF
LLLLLVAAFALALPFYWHRNLTTSPSPEKSIAVLPFENLSRDPDNAYFADGIQEEILTRLASIADLKVISRTSTQRYQSKPRNLREIAKQLGVANILEGSVQKAADQVRVNVQLVNAQTDSHLWADSYDRKLTDIFGVEGEIAKGIAESLQAKLTAREEQVLAVKPTNNPEAYEAYLRGLAFEGRSSSSFGSYSPDLVGQAAGFFERAVQLDSNFALAWARLSHANAHLYFSGGLQSTSAQRDIAKRALDNAQKLEPNSPETLLATGYYQYYVLGDYGLAKSTFRLVSKMLPSSNEVPTALGRVTRREGHWDESVAYFEQALTLDPRNVELLMELAETYGTVRQFPAALKLYDRVLDIKPNDLIVMAEKASIYQAQGNLQEAATFLSEINEQTPDELTFDTKISQLRLERNYGEAVRLLQARLAQFHLDSQDEKEVYQVALALTQRLASDTASAKATAEQSRDILERLYRDESRSPKARAHYAADLSQAYAAMGEKELALKTAADAIMLWPRAKDPKVGPVFEQNLAIIQTIFGENNRAISTLTQLSQTPYSGRITPALLRLDPIWDPLRSDARFKKLVEESKQPIALELVGKNAPEKSIAVLPFENASNEPNSEYLSEGISEALINSLSELQQLRVIARPTAFHYKRKDVDPRQVGRELGVAAVLTGKVRQMQDALNVQVDLVDAVTGAEIWGAGYDRKITDLLAVKQAITQEVAAKLKLKLSSEEQRRLVKRDTTNAEAYQFYLRGRYFWNKRT